MSAVLDGETLALRNGREVQLLGINAPVLPPGREGPESWPFAVQAKQAFAALVEVATAELRFDASKEDQYGHVVAQVSVDRHGEPAWVEEALVAKGLVRVAALPDLGACLGPLLAVDTSTREAWREARSF